jgi:hypothetical protein
MLIASTGVTPGAILDPLFNRTVRGGPARVESLGPPVLPFCSLGFERRSMELHLLGSTAETPFRAAAC